MRKFIVFILCLAVLLGTCPTAYAISFTDVPEGSYYFEPVYNIAWNGIIGGFPDGSFKPASPLTREQMAVMLVNMSQLSTISPAVATFPDVPQTRWSYPYIEAAVKAGFIAGYLDPETGEKTFKPERNVSYDEALTMLVALLGYSLKDLGGTYPTAFTNKARDLGILNTCAMLGSNAATRANVSCFIRDAVIARSDNPDFFKFKGTNYSVTLGRDLSYFVEEGSRRTDGYGIVLTIENTSENPIPYSATSFTAEFDGKTYLVDTASYDAFKEFSVPSGTIGAGQTVSVTLLFACRTDLEGGHIYPNLSTGTEAEIELIFQ